MKQRVVAALFCAALGVSACAYYHDSGYGYGGHSRMYGDYRYGDRDYSGWRTSAPAGFTGSGAARLDPWLAETHEGRALVAQGFDSERDRRLTTKIAERANRWFRRHADRDRDLRLTDPEIRLALAQLSRR